MVVPACRRATFKTPKFDISTTFSCLIPVSATTMDIFSATEEAWLDPKQQDPEKIVRFLRPCPSTWLKSVEIGTAINSPINNRPEVLEPIGEVN